MTFTLLRKGMQENMLVPLCISLPLLIGCAKHLWEYVCGAEGSFHLVFAHIFSLFPSIHFLNIWWLCYNEGQLKASKIQQQQWNETVQFCWICGDFPIGSLFQLLVSLTCIHSASPSSMSTLFSLTSFQNSNKSFLDIDFQLMRYRIDERFGQFSMRKVTASRVRFLKLSYSVSSNNFCICRAYFEE